MVVGSLSDIVVAMFWLIESDSIPLDIRSVLIEGAT